MSGFFKITKRFAPFLLTYLTVIGLPPTNNTTEQFFGRIRTKLRRITGRQNNNNLIITRGNYIALSVGIESYQETLDRISTVSYCDYVNEKEECKKKNTTHQIQRKVRKDPNGYLSMLVFGWKQLAEKGVLTK
jgi:hypothetical protein